MMCCNESNYRSSSISDDLHFPDSSVRTGGEGGGRRRFWLSGDARLRSSGILMFRKRLEYGASDRNVWKAKNSMIAAGVMGDQQESTLLLTSLILNAIVLSVQI